MTQKRQMIIEIPMSYYLELKEMADKHLVAPSNLAANIVVAAVQEYLKRGQPKMIMPAEGYRDGKRNLGTDSGKCKA